MNTLTEDEIKSIATLTANMPNTWRVNDEGSFTCDQDAYALHNEKNIARFDSEAADRNRDRNGSALMDGGFLFFDSREGAMQFNKAVPLLAEKCGAAADRQNDDGQWERLWDADKGEQVIPTIDDQVSAKLLRLAPLTMGRTNVSVKEQKELKQRLSTLFKSQNPLLYYTHADGYWSEVDEAVECTTEGVQVVPFEDLERDEEGDHLLPEKYLTTLKQVSYENEESKKANPSKEEDWYENGKLHEVGWRQGVDGYTPADMCLTITHANDLSTHCRIADFSFNTLDYHRYNTYPEMLENYWNKHESVNENDDYVWKMDGHDYEKTGGGYYGDSWATPEIKQKSWYLDWLDEVQNARKDATAFQALLISELGLEEYTVVLDEELNEDKMTYCATVSVSRIPPQLPYHALALYPKMAKEIESCHEMLRTLLTHAQATNDEVVLQHLAPFDMATMEGE